MPCRCSLLSDPDVELSSLGHILLNPQALVSYGGCNPRQDYWQSPFFFLLKSHLNVTCDLWVSLTPAGLTLDNLAEFCPLPENSVKTRHMQDYVNISRLVTEAGFCCQFLSRS